MRVDNWRSEFSKAIDDMRHKPFSWGENDCAVGLVRNLIKAMTGEDVCKEYFKKYKTPAGGYKLMKNAGFENIGDMVASVLKEIHISEAAIGDIVAIKTDDKFGYALGVVNNDRVFVMSETGVGTVNLFSAERAFRVE